MMRNDSRLFNKNNLYSVLEEIKNKALHEIKALKLDQLESYSNEELIDHFFCKHQISPINLLLENQERSISECMVRARNHFDYDFDSRENIQVSGIRILVKIPYNGHPGLFNCSPDTMTLRAVSAAIVDPNKDGYGSVECCFEFDKQHTADEYIKNEIESRISFISETLENQRKQIATFEFSLKDALQLEVLKRRAEAKSFDGLAKSLNIPVKENVGMPSLKPIKVSRKINQELPEKKARNQSNGYSISDQSYRDILAAIRAQGRTFEKTPKTFNKFDEEELRDIVLGNLNTHFQGQATGETFRAKGKTDICIEENNQAAFVAECKVWRGAKELVDGLHQLLGYLTWRDCKAALIVFNKDRSRFSEIIEKAPISLRDISELFVREMVEGQPGEWSFVFKSPDDDGRFITVHLMIYNLYINRQ